MVEGGRQFPKFLTRRPSMMADGGQKVHQTSMTAIISFPVKFFEMYLDILNIYKFI
jgi:hypothetical protein